MESTPLLHSQPQTRSQPSSRTLLLICLITFLFIEIGSYMLLIPQTRIYESILCKRYYNDGRTQIPEEECKIAPVQGELATIRAVSASMVAIPGILLSVPYGQLADNPKIGRKLVLAISYLGVLFQGYTELLICWLCSSLDGSGGPSLRLVWLAPIWTVFGGGSGVLSAIIFTMITDAVDISKRSTAFVYVSLTLQISQLVAPVTAAWIMARSPFLAYVVSVILVTIGLPILLLSLPETIHIRHSNSDMRDEQEHDPQIISSEDEPRESVSGTNSGMKSSKNRIREIIHDWRFLKNPNILMLLSSFCLYWLGRAQMDLLVQYISTRYGRSLSSAGFIMSMNAAMSLILLMVLIPFVKQHLQTAWRLSSPLADLWVLKGSIIFLTLGCIGIGAAPTLPTMLVGDALYILGAGFSPIARGLLTVYVDQSHVARLHALISIVQLLGLLLGSPLLAMLFDRGFAIGREWTGLPFLGSGVLHLLLCLVIWTIEVPAVVSLR